MFQNFSSVIQIHIKPLRAGGIYFMALKINEGLHKKNLTFLTFVKKRTEKPFLLLKNTSLLNFRFGIRITLTQLLKTQRVK